MANNEPPPNWLTVLYRAFLSPTKAKKSYSQFGEDLILQTLPNFPEKGFFGNKPMFITHNSTEAIDIDTEDDFLMAENLVQVIDKKEGFS